MRGHGRTAMTWSIRELLWKQQGAPICSSFAASLTVLLESYARRRVRLDDFASNRVPDKFVGRVEADLNMIFKLGRLSVRTAIAARLDLLIRFPFRTGAAISNSRGVNRHLSAPFGPSWPPCGEILPVQFSDTLASRTATLTMAFTLLGGSPEIRLKRYPERRHLARGGTICRLMHREHKDFVSGTASRTDATASTPSSSGIPISRMARSVQFYGFCTASRPIRCLANYFPGCE